MENENMLKRHGLFRQMGTPKPGDRLTPEQAGVFRNGILQVFEALRTGPFLIDVDGKRRAGQLQYHFSEVVRRFIYSLQHLNVLMQRMADVYPDVARTHELVQLDLQAGCQADHVLTYLNTIVDDIAHIIVLATGATHPKHPKKQFESMGDLKNPAGLTVPALAPISARLQHQDTQGSWWDLAFRHRSGARQLLIHNQFIVAFQAAIPPGKPLEVQANLISAYKEVPVGGDFSARLRAILTDLCNWLDGLEEDLVTYLLSKDPSWKPMVECPRVLLGLGPVVYHSQYFPLPLCEHSDPLPWEFK
jgi:hypothetical protein